MKSKIYFYAVIAIGTMLIAGCSKNTTEPENKNRSPQISSIIPNPENVMVNQVTSLTCLAEDADGDQLTYVWEADTGTFNGTGSRVDWTAPGTEGLYQILCKVMDGNGGEAQQEVMIDVMPPGNQPPQIASLTSSADSVEVSESVTLTCNATDPDGDALTFNWEVEHGQITGSGNPVDWTAPDSQGTYTVICKVSDGISGEVSESLFIAVTEPVLPTDGLLAYYPFNGTARDESGNNKDGVLMGAATANEVLKIDDNASDRLWLPYGIVDGLTNFTVSAWLKINTLHPGYLNTWLSGASSQSHNGFSLWYSHETNYNERWRFIIQNAGYDFERNDIIKDLDWHHVLILRDGPTARLYIDGNKIGSSIAVSADPIDVAENGYFAGQEQDAVGGSFNQRQSWAGEMDNLRFYDRVLTEAEIQKLAGEPHSN